MVDRLWTRTSCGCDKSELSCNTGRPVDVAASRQERYWPVSSASTESWDAREADSSAPEWEIESLQQYFMS